MVSDGEARSPLSVDDPEVGVLDGLAVVVQTKLQKLGLRRVVCVHPRVGEVGSLEGRVLVVTQDPDLLLAVVAVEEDATLTRHYVASHERQRQQAERRLRQLG